MTTSATPTDVSSTADEAAVDSEADEVIKMLADLKPEDLKKVSVACDDMMKSSSGADPKTEVDLGE